MIEDMPKPGVGEPSQSRRQSGTGGCVKKRIKPPFSLDEGRALRALRHSSAFNIPYAIISRDVPKTAKFPATNINHPGMVLFLCLAILVSSLSTI